MHVQPAPPGRVARGAPDAGRAGRDVEEVRRGDPSGNAAASVVVGAVEGGVDRAEDAQVARLLDEVARVLLTRRAVGLGVVQA
jgi:hypothetical protein